MTKLCQATVGHVNGIQVLSPSNMYAESLFAQLDLTACPVASPRVTLQG